MRDKYTLEEQRDLLLEDLRRLHDNLIDASDDDPYTDLKALIRDTKFMISEAEGRKGTNAEVGRLDRVLNLAKWFKDQYRERDEEDEDSYEEYMGFYTEYEVVCFLIDQAGDGEIMPIENYYDTSKEAF